MTTAPVPWRTHTLLGALFLLHPRLLDQLPKDVRSDSLDMIDDELLLLSEPLPAAPQLVQNIS